jgi:hypothetical protein
MSVPVYTMGFKNVSGFTLEICTADTLETSQVEIEGGDNNNNNNDYVPHTATITWDIPWFFTIACAISVRTYVHREGAMMASLANGSADYYPKNVIRKIETLDNSVFSKLDIDETNYDLLDMDDTMCDKLEFSKVSLSDGYHVFWKQL